ncbi:MAG: TonB-dependent receptor [Acidobacteriota bacterium]
MHRSLLAFPLAVFLILFATSGIHSPAEAQQATSELQGKVVDQQGSAMPGVTIVIRNQDSGLYREAVSNADGSYFVTAMIPAVYEVSAELPGFKKYARRGVRLEVGKTTTVEIRLELGGIEETVTVTAEAPLVDVSSKEVGGYIQSQELLDTPSFNRNFTGYLGLLPGVVSGGSTASFAADSISVNGQSTVNVAYNFDGASNDDDNLGGSAGAQARIPVEAVQEFQLLTGQFDAEFGQASGGVLNAVSKQGTNRYRGSVFGFFKDAAITEEDFFVRTQRLDKPDTKEQQWGFTVGGPLVRDKIHFFWSLERVAQNKGVTVNIPARPEFNFAGVEEVRPWNLFGRGDHQINANHTWGVRWLYETSPSSHLAPTWKQGSEEIEQDHDWATVGTLNSVLGNNKVNSLTIGAVYENLHWESSADGFSGALQSTRPPRLDHLTYTAGAIDTSFFRKNLTYSLEDKFSWFVPNKMGSHDVKFGAQYRYMHLDYFEANDRNGTFTFNTDLDFNPGNPFTYPERLNVQVPGDREYVQFGHLIGGFVQDKWRLNNRLTISLGARYDLELLPTPNAENPFWNSSAKYPIDKNNFAPRLGFSHVLDRDARSVLRGGYGRFYQKNRLTNLNELIPLGVFTDSFNVLFPLNSIDPGPSSGRFPTDPLLVNGPVVNRTLLAQMFPPGTRQRNRGTVYLDNPDRRSAYADQFSVGVERQIARDMAVSADYIRIQQRDLLLGFNLNQPTRSSTSRTGRLIRPLPDFSRDVLQMLSAGSIDHDGLQVQLDKRYSNNYRWRVSYTLGHTRGNTAFGNRETVPTQLGNDLRLDQNEGPAGNDRRHNFVTNWTWEVPGTRGLRFSGVFRAMSGLAFSLMDSSADLDRNGSFANEWLAPGTYSGRGDNAYTVEYKGGPNGARGPAFYQLDLRGGYSFRFADGQSFELYADVINVTNRSNFDPPSGDRRLSSFLVLRELVNDGLPRQAQVGLRLAF